MSVLYTFYHGAAFAWVLAHKLGEKTDEIADLLLADGWDWSRYTSFLKKFKEKGIFQNIYVYDNSLGRYEDSLKNTEDVILEGIDTGLREQGCDLSKYDCIYSNTDGEDTIGIYFSLKKINYYWFEFAKNGLNQRNEDWVKSEYAHNIGYRDALLKHKTMFGGNSYQKFILNPDSDKSHYELSRVSYFDAVRALRLLNNDMKNMLLEMFDIDNKALTNDIACLYLQSNWLPSQVYKNCPYIRNRYNHHWLYMYHSIQTMLDYYCAKDIVPILKTHPTVLIDKNVSEQYFGGVYAFPALFSVILTQGLLPDFNPLCKVLLSSTANDMYDESENDIHCPGVWLYSDFTNKYYVSLLVINHLNALYKDVGEKFGSIGESGMIMAYNNELLYQDIKSLLKINFNDVSDMTNKRYKVIQNRDELLKDNLMDYDFIIYTDIMEELSTAEYFRLAQNINIMPIHIMKVANKDIKSIIEPLSDEYIYLISKYNWYIDKLHDFSIEKILPTTGISIYACCADV
ncbi:MAG: hypothetical protein K5773_03070 [Pseudobutyrivibrio sp.]|nr:hypothetical protein [Pseudobutyrivibrio sp.]